MNNLKEYLIGFDARRMVLRASERWSDRRKKEYLIDTNIKRVLSTDDLVWPSLFEQRISQQILNIEPEKRKEMFPHVDLNQVGPFAPEWIGPNGSFWENLNELRRHVDLVNSKEEIWVIAGTIFVDNETKTNLRPDWPPYIEPTEPLRLDPSWPLLGYDVSDGSCLSGLSNCGYRETDFAHKSREYWSEKINEHHLFTDFDTAIEFRQFSNERIPEHAPFFIYGLYLIEILNAEQRAPLDRE